MNNEFLPHLILRLTKNKSNNLKNRKVNRKSGFTLLQIVVVIGIFLFFTSWVAYSTTAGRAVAREAECNNNLKAIALAIDAYHQEHKTFPTTLAVLRQMGYLPDSRVLNCPDAPDSEGTYEEFYVVRAPRNNQDLPVLVCPYHETSHRGVQAFIGRRVEDFSTQPARLTGANDVTVQRPGSAPVTGVTGMELHGADIIRTGIQGAAVITFADRSTATLQRQTEVTLLQSFMDGKVRVPLYTLVRQHDGTVRYDVNHGSKFDVATPTAVCGALGTQFTITVIAPNAAGNGASTKILLTQGKVLISTRKRSALAPLNSLYTITGGTLDLPGLAGATSLVQGLVPGGLPALPGAIPTLPSAIPTLPGALPTLPGALPTLPSGP